MALALSCSPWLPTQKFSDHFENFQACSLLARRSSLHLYQVRGGHAGPLGMLGVVKESAISGVGNEKHAFGLILPVRGITATLGGDTAKEPRYSRYNRSTRAFVERLNNKLVGGLLTTACYTFLSFIRIALKPQRPRLMSGVGFIEHLAVSSRGMWDYIKREA